ncbi:MAG TPA: helix-turn-helix domain-containing protein [Anaerolineales bacterium]|nr:helix-turn-helix domain-containing protein [Anaerolineales bacterium]
MPRKSKIDWLEIGLQALGQSGLEALTIDGLATRIGLTKGSFYHHFESMQDYEQQLLAHWANQYLSTSASLPVEPHERLILLDSLMENTFGPITEPEISIRTWAQQNDQVRPYVEQVDAFRRQLILDIFSSLLSEEEQAQMMTDMLFTITIGSMATFPRLSPERVLKMYRELKRLFGL